MPLIALQISTQHPVVFSGLAELKQRAEDRAEQARFLQMAEEGRDDEIKGELREIVASFRRKIHNIDFHYREPSL